METAASEAPNWVNPSTGLPLPTRRAFVVHVNEPVPTHSNEAAQYATIFYATLESEIVPRFAALGFDAERAWRERGGELGD